MRNLLIFLAVVAAIALIVLGLPAIPEVGFMAMLFFVPLWIGGLLHLALLAMLILALVGWLPRLALIVPLAVWIGGVSTWAYASHAAGQQALALKTTIPLAQKPREIIVRGDRAVAMDLVADYDFDAVYTEFHRHAVAKGAPDCTPRPKVDSLRLMWLPPKLLARGECVISTRIEAPPAALVEVTHLRTQGQLSATGGDIIPLKITSHETGQEKSWTVKSGTMQIPAPMVFPIVGFFYGSRDGRRSSVAEMWHLDYPLVPGAENDTPFEARARFIAQTLGVGRRYGE